MIFGGGGINNLQKKGGPALALSLVRPRGYSMEGGAGVGAGGILSPHVLSPNTEGYLSPRVLSPNPEGYLSPLKGRGLDGGEHSPKGYSVFTDRSLSLTQSAALSGSNTPLNISGKERTNAPNSVTPPNLAGLPLPHKGPGQAGSASQALWGKMRASVVHNNHHLHLNHNNNNNSSGTSSNVESRSGSPLPPSSSAAVTASDDNNSAKGPGLGPASKAKKLWGKLQTVVLLPEAEGQGQGLGLGLDLVAESTHATLPEGSHSSRSHSSRGPLSEGQKESEPQSHVRRESSRDMLGLGPSLTDRRLGLGLAPGLGQRSKGVCGHDLAVYYTLSHSLMYHNTTIRLQ